MGIKRGSWQPNFNKKATEKSNHSKVKPAKILVQGQSNSETYLKNRDTNKINGPALNSVSEHRQEELRRGTGQIDKQGYNAPPIIAHSGSYKKTQEMRKQYGLDKRADTTVGGTSFSVSGGGDTIRLAPEVYSPLFQIANLQLPRDRVTMNAWNRNFYDTHPLVRNCINLHATYPLGRMNIKCKEKKVEQFFGDMMDEMDLLGIVQNIALEFFKLGESFPYAELDADRGMWKDILIQNPDYVHVKRSVLGGESVISLGPDAALQRLVTSNNPADIQLRKQISPEIIHHIRKGNNIPLDNFHISHLKMTSSPYDIHGTSMIVSIYKDLMLYDKLRECFDFTTEILTDRGICKGLDAIEYEEIDGKIKNVKIKDNIKIACFNPKNGQIEYHKPTNVHLSHYKGNMYHFNGQKVDVMTTPNHRMWVSRKLSKGWSEWELKQAKDMSNGTMYRFQGTANWKGEDKEYVEVCGAKVPIKDYLKVLGYIISEGCVYGGEHLHKNGNKYKRGSISVYQNIHSDCYDDIRSSFVRFGDIVGKHVSHYIDKNDVWCGSINGKDVHQYFVEQIGQDNKCKSFDKRIPRFVMGMSPRHLRLLLDALVNGDGSIQKNKYKHGFKYFSISKDLCDDVSEVVLKCGFSPNTYSCTNGDGKKYWVTSWTENDRGKFPKVYGNKKYRNANIDKVDYDGLVWCFEVPTGLFITRRNGLYTIQGNSKFSQADNLVNPITLVKIGGSTDGEYRATEADLESWRQTLEQAQYDKDFKIISHAGVSIERVGATGTIIDISSDMNFIIDNILYGLMVPKAILTQEGSSYSSASIGLEVLKQRYEAFRNMMAKWLVMKIFAPISEIHEFYEYRDGDKKLIVPEVDWNQMILFDMDNYINVLNNLHQKDQAGIRSVSKDTLFRSLGLDPEEERRKIREEMIQEEIMTKEQMLVRNMELSALRAVKSDEDIIEPTTEPLPGTPGSEESGIPTQGPGGMGIPGLDMGMPPMPGGGLGGPMPGGLPGGGAGLPELGGPGGAPPIGGEIPGGGGEGPAGGGVPGV